MKFSPLHFLPNYSPGRAESASVCNRLLAISTNVVSPGGPINFNRGSTENQGMRPNITPVKISERLHLGKRKGKYINI